MNESRWRNSNEFAEWLNRYNRLNHADLTTKTAPEYLLVEFVEMGIDGSVERLTAENAKLREQLAEAQRIISYIDKKFPLADKTCDEPGITLSEAVRRTLADMDTDNAD